MGWTRSSRRRIRGAAGALVAAVVLLVGCTSADGTTAPPAAGAAPGTGAVDAGTATAGSRPTSPPEPAFAADATPDQLEVLDRGTLTSSTHSAPVATDPSRLEAPHEPDELVPPGGVVDRGIPWLTSLSLGDWYVTRNGIVRLDLGTTAAASSAYRFPDGCTGSSFGLGTSLVTILCDEPTTAESSHCSIHPFDTTTSTFADAHDIPDDFAAGLVSSWPTEVPIMLVVHDRGIPSVPRNRVVDSTTGTWQELEIPCGAYDILVVQTESETDDRGAVELGVSCPEDSSTARFDLHEPHRRRSTAAVDWDQARQICTFDGGRIELDEEHHLWQLREDDDPGGEPVSTLAATELAISCVADGDLLALSYSTYAEAVVELRRRADLEVVGTVRWPSRHLSRNPMPTAPSVIALDGRRVWLATALGNLAHLDL